MHNALAAGLEFCRKLRAFNQVSRLALNRRERGRQLVSFCWLFLTDRSSIARDRPIVLRGGYGSLLVHDHTEALVVGEIFVGQCYADEALPPVIDLVLDLGCNIGAASIWFAERYPDAVVVGVEADPRTADLARRNTERYRNIRVLNAAVSSHSGTAMLQVSDSWASTTVGVGRGGAIEVPAVLLDDLLDHGGPRRLLKIDIEGAEHEVLRACKRLRELEFITGEFHPLEGESWEALLATLHPFDVRMTSKKTADYRHTFVAQISP